MLDTALSDTALVAELGRRIAQHRIARNLTQGEFADGAGVGRSTVQRIERGESVQLSSFVKLLRALDRLEALDVVLAADVRSPVAELERQRRNQHRQRVRHGRGAAPADPAKEAPEPWTWGDEGERR